ncbi:MAG TPA: peptidoglycan-binding protein [Clostridia bacterium]|nr:peptidoglycan-binding protein [Clostridia bacterium]
MKIKLAWIAAAFLLLTGFLNAALSEADQLNAPSLPVAQVTTGKGPLNLRKRPDDRSDVLERIPNRSLVSVIEQGDIFWEIQYGDEQGYAMCEFLTMTDYAQDILNYRLLYRGNTGGDVLSLKKRLLELGYYRAGSDMTDDYNNTCVERIKMFQRQNSLNEDGIATSEVQAKLFSDAAVPNAEELPKAIRLGYVAAPAPLSSGGSADTDWDQWMLDHPGICPCCKGAGCDCCDYTGKL